MTEDPFLNRQSDRLDGIAWYSIGATLFTMAAIGFAIVFVDTHDFWPGAGMLTCLFLTFICNARADLCHARILTEMKELNDIVQSISAGAKPAGGPQQETALRPAGSETVLYFNDEIARIK